MGLITYEPSSGLLYRGLLGLTSLTILLGVYFTGAFLGLITYEPSSGLLHRGLLGLTSLTSLLAGYFTGDLLWLALMMSLPGLLKLLRFSHLVSTMASE